MTNPPVGSTQIPLPKIPTHIEGLDSILLGGLPSGRTSLLMGMPGSGKTVLGIEFLYRGALHNEPGIFLGFEESTANLRQNAQTMGWDLAALEADNKLFLLDSRIDPEAIINGEFSLKPMLAIISGKAQELGARRIVLDALDVLLRLFDNPIKIRSELHMLDDWLTTCGMTAVMTIKPREGEFVRAFLDFFYSMSDCVIMLDARVQNQISVRRMRIIKYRGSDFGRNEYPYVITGSGVKTLPISAVSLQHKPFGERISSGIRRLDDILGGGYFRASCILVAGAPGTGKTMLASSFVRQACRNGEKVLYISLEESDQALLKNITSTGIDLKPFVDDGLLRYSTTMPESKGAEEHLLRYMRLIDEFNPGHVVLDAISALERMGGKEIAYEFSMRFLNYLKERGITVFFVNQTSGATDQLEISGNGISSMVDTVMLISYIRAANETNRTIEVLKMRGSAHSNQMREFKITDNGLEILDVYAGAGQVLTGTARQVQEARDRLETFRAENNVQLKQMELAALQDKFRAETAHLQNLIETTKLELANLQLERDRAHIEQEGRRQSRGQPLNHAVAGSNTEEERD